MTLRYQASEMNRLAFQHVGDCPALIRDCRSSCVMLFGSRENKFVLVGVLLMLLLVLVAATS